METYIHDTDLELTGLSRKIFVTAMNLGASIYTGHMAHWPGDHMVAVMDESDAQKSR